jgi:hypothetical protein
VKLNNFGVWAKAGEAMTTGAARSITANPALKAHFQGDREKTHYNGEVDRAL